MGLKYRIGATARGALDAMLRNRAFPLTRYFPRGVNWMYDVQRYAGTRQLHTIFDVGANIGQTVGALLPFFPNANIFCFEPVSASYQELTQAFGERAHCFNLALGNEIGTRTIKLQSNSELNTFHHVKDPGASFTGVLETVNIVTLDTFCGEHNILSIDLLKLDVQGWESDVIEGAGDLLDKKKVRFIFAEAAFRRGDGDMTLFGFLDEKLAERGFLFSGFYDFVRYGDRKEFTLFANALYMNPAFVPA